MPQTSNSKGFVSDFAGVLDRAYQGKLEGELREVASQGGPEIAVVTLPSLEGRQVEEVARSYFDAWGVGKKEADNGVMLLVAMKDRAIRIETGYGVEGNLTDQTAGRIIREVIAPAFKQGKIQEGIEGGLHEIIKKVGEEKQVESENPFIFWLAVGFLILAIALMPKSRNSPFYRGPYGGSHRGGGGFGGFGGGRGGGGGASGGW